MSLSIPENTKTIEVNNINIYNEYNQLIPLPKSGSFNGKVFYENNTQKFAWIVNDKIVSIFNCEYYTIIDEYGEIIM